MEQNNSREDDELRARLETLKEEMEAGRVHFAPHLKVIESLKAVRQGPDGKIDLSTVDGGVRALANMATFSRQRREAKEAVSLRDLQSTYFDFIEKNFGWLYADMKKQGADPSQVGSALAANPDASKKSGLECPGSYSRLMPCGKKFGIPHTITFRTSQV